MDAAARPTVSAATLTRYAERQEQQLDAAHRYWSGAPARPAADLAASLAAILAPNY